MKTSQENNKKISSQKYYRQFPFINRKSSNTKAFNQTSLKRKTNRILIKKMINLIKRTRLNHYKKKPIPKRRLKTDCRKIKNNRKNML